MKINDAGLKVLEERYLKKDIDGKVCETPEDLFKRVADAVAKVYPNNSNRLRERLSQDFYTMMVNGEFLPNSPTLMNAGKPLGQLSACFVLPIEDSMESIFGTLKNAALVHKTGGGTGFSFSKLRPSNSIVNSTKGVASGPVSFMKIYNEATEQVKQGGTRRGANMGILRVDHPDILEFIDCKNDKSKFQNFNISVGITDRFMKALEDDENWNLYTLYSLGVAHSTLNAKEVLTKIAMNAWATGEPGIVFLDTINKRNYLDEEIEATNPCGEQPLLPYESCNLGSIDVSKFYDPSKNSGIDLSRLREVAGLATYFLDSVITINEYPLEEIKEKTLETRKIGLGIMGFADLCHKLGVCYGGNERCLNLIHILMQTICSQADRISTYLGHMVEFYPAYKEGLPERRNLALTCIAPTGTISMIADCSSGIEPIFSLAYTKTVMDGQTFVYANKELVAALEKLDMSKSEIEDTLKLVKDNGGSIQNIDLKGSDDTIQNIKNLFRTAQEISPADHLAVQAQFQKYVDAGVSKTINLKSNATVEDIQNIYVQAWKKELKGVTVYRDGTRDGQVLQTSKKPSEKEKRKEKEKVIPREREEVTTGFTEKMKIGCGNLYITVNADKQGLCEVFTNLGRAGGCPSQSEATSRLISTMLRCGIEKEVIIEQLKGIRCHSTMRRKGAGNLSCPDAIGRALETHPINGNIPTVPDIVIDAVESKEDPPQDHSLHKISSTTISAEDNSTICPECHESLIHYGGCVVCLSCGYSKCG